jgi:hypothetical protein
MNRLYESSRSTLRRFIQEVLHVTITTQDANGKGVTYERDIEDPDKALDLEWELSKLKLMPLSFVKTKEKEKALERVENTRTIRQLAAQLVSNPQDVENLVEILLPWRAVGYEALDKLRLIKERRMKTFPFFSYPTPTTKTTIPLSVVDPYMREFLLNVNARIGSSITGKGEFLLSLLTGGISGGDEGDININGQQWEVKDSRDGGDIRLGDVTSAKFVAELGGMNPDDMTQEELDSVLKKSLGKIAGFVILTQSGFEFREITNAKFSRLNKAKRVHVKFGPLPKDNESSNGPDSSTQAITPPATAKGRRKALPSPLLPPTT